MTEKKKLIITICATFLAIIVGVVGVFVTAQQTGAVNNFACCDFTGVSGSQNIKIAGGASKNNGTVFAEDFVFNYGFDKNSPVKMEKDCGQRFFSMYLSDGEKRGNNYKFEIETRVIDCKTSNFSYNVQILPALRTNNISVFNLTTYELLNGLEVVEQADITNSANDPSGHTFVFNNGKVFKIKTLITVGIVDFAYATNDLEFKVFITLSSNFV